jgi:hypothetical protein
MSVSQPWANGPREILEHGISLLGRDSDTNRRLSFLSIDNAVELMLRTYLSLPNRVTGLRIGRAEYDELSGSFPRLLDAMEKHAHAKLSGISLAEIEWYHRLRNQLYHQGNGLTVERSKVEVYAELAKVLFRNLFGVELDAEEALSATQELVGEFLRTWNSVEEVGYQILLRLQLEAVGPFPIFTEGVVGQLLDRKVLDEETAEVLGKMQDLRSRIVHGDADAISLLTSGTISLARSALDLLRDTLEMY